MTYPDSVRFLYSLGNELKTVKFDLERITALLHAMGSPHHGFASVHVAGTNGKGSTCAMIESGLRAGRVRTGLFTSPHLLQPTERIRIAGEPVSEHAFTNVFDRVHATAEDLLSRGAIDFHPTYFETVTAMAFLLFQDSGVEMAVVEVGMGGRLDATNVLTPRLCVITRVEFDHERFLGNSIEAIATEKAGILKVGVPALFACQRAEAEAVLVSRASDLRIPVSKSMEREISNLEIHREGHRYVSRGVEVACPLAGEHQVENSLTALAALELLGVDRTAIESGIQATLWPGRLQRISRDPEIIVDGAHNPSGAQALAAYIRRFYAPDDVTLIFGAMRDKAVEEVADTLFPVAGSVIVTAPKQERALRPDALSAVVPHPDLRRAETLESALLMADPARTTFITGSLFLVAEALSLHARKPDIIPGALR